MVVCVKGDMMMLTKKIILEVMESEKEYNEGKFKSFDSVEELIEYLTLR